MNNFDFISQCLSSNDDVVGKDFANVSDLIDCSNNIIEFKSCLFKGCNLSESNFSGCSFSKSKF